MNQILVHFCKKLLTNLYILCCHHPA